MFEGLNGHFGNARYLGLAIWRAVSRAFVRRRTVARLRMLDDHLLRDIGVIRSEIEATVEARLAAEYGRAAAPWTLEGARSSAGRRGSRAPFRMATEKR
jgi:uncharacterized protein YjiS (DUF1127 family)